MPVPISKVEAETPLSLHGDIEERPKPAPKATRTSVNAAAATAPAAIAGQDAPVSVASVCTSTISTAVSIAMLLDEAIGRTRNSAATTKVPADDDFLGKLSLVAHCTRLASMVSNFHPAAMSRHAFVGWIFISGRRAIPLSAICKTAMEKNKALKVSGES